MTGVLKTLIIAMLLTTAAAAQQQLRPGTAAPDFTAESLDGKYYSLSQLQGKVVVLTFWSTRCEICIAEIPKLNRVAERYSDQDVVFLGLTMENGTRIEPFLRKHPFHFSIVPNSFGVVLKYADMDKSGGIDMGFPTHFVINKHGAIVHRTAGWDKAENIDAQISKVLASD
ncbi:MAG: TlpA family protein disulfide reductase [Pyrinomonadaceae bacterium]